MNAILTSTLAIVSAALFGHDQVEEVAVVPDEAPAVLAETNPVELGAASAVTFTLAFATLTDAEIYAKAADAIEAIDTMKARFLQTAPSGNVMAGTLSLNRPGQLRFDYDDPSDQLVVATGGVVYVHDAALETTDSYPVRKTPLRFLLSRRIDRDQAELREVHRSENGVAILLAATDEDVSGELALVFSAPEMTLKEWVVSEPSGAVTRVSLSDVELGGKLSRQLFRVPDSGGAFLKDR